MNNAPNHDSSTENAVGIPLGEVAKKRSNLLRVLFIHSLRTYFEKTNGDYWRRKYPNATEEQIIQKIIKLAAGNAAIVGSLCGLLVSGDEIITIILGPETAGLDLIPGIVIATGLIGGEVYLLTKIFLKMTFSIATVLKIPLDPNNDAEDALFVSQTAFSGGVIEGVGKLLVKSVAKNTIPIFSILVGGIWNSSTAKKFGKIVTKNLKTQMLGYIPQRKLGCLGWVLVLIILGAVFYLFHTGFFRIPVLTK